MAPKRKQRGQRNGRSGIMAACTPARCFCCMFLVIAMFNCLVMSPMYVLNESKAVLPADMPRWDPGQTFDSSIAAPGKSALLPVGQSAVLPADKPPFDPRSKLRGDSGQTAFDSSVAEPEDGQSQGIGDGADETTTSDGPIEEPEAAPNSVGSVADGSSSEETASTKTDIGMPLKIYWIARSVSSEDDDTMTQMLAGLEAGGVPVSVTRVEATSERDVQDMVASGALELALSNGTRDGHVYKFSRSVLIDRCLQDRDERTRCSKHNAIDEFTYAQVAASVSHLRAVQLAESEQAEMALILEDDVMVYQDFWLKLKELLQHVQDSWEILQFSVRNIEAISQFADINDPFVRWVPQYSGVGAYLIKRSGMRRLMQVYRHNDGFSFQKKVAVPHEVLFAFAETSTCTRSFFNFRLVKQMDSALMGYEFSISQNDVIYIAQQHASAWRKLYRVERRAFLITTTVSVKEADSLDSLRTLEILAASIRQVRDYGATWEIFMVSKNKTLEDGWRGLVEQYDAFSEDGVHLRYNINPERYSKMLYYSELIDIMEEYEHVVIMDPDMGLSGFPWRELFYRIDTFVGRVDPQTLLTSSTEDLKSAVIGVVRQGYPDSMLSSPRGFNSYWSIFDGDWWRHCGREGNTWEEVDIIEQWFVMLNGAFAAWFFRETLSWEFLELHRQLRIAWGFDNIWCAASAEWLKSRSSNEFLSDKAVHGCVLFPLNMIHHDSKTLTHAKGSKAKDKSGKSLDIREDGKAMSEAYATIFPRWHRYSWAFHRFYGSNCRDLKLMCDIFPPGGHPHMSMIHYNQKKKVQPPKACWLDGLPADPSQQGRGGDAVNSSLLVR